MVPPVTSARNTESGPTLTKHQIQTNHREMTRIILDVHDDCGTR